MKKIIINTLFVLVFAGLIVSGCKKEEARPAPTITFISGGDYTSTNAIFHQGDTILIGIECEWNGTDLIQTLNAYLNDIYIGSEEIIPDLGEGFIYNLTIEKSAEAIEKWDFELVDSQGEKSKVTLTFTLSTNVRSFSDVKIGAQENLSDYSYYGLNSNLVYNHSTGQENQNLVDFLGFYNDIDYFQLLSPASPDLPEPYMTEMADWNEKNTTKFLETAITPSEFDAINNYNQIYDAFSSSASLDKAKNLVVGNVYSFKTENGSYGLFKVTSVTGATNGNAIIQIKTK